MRVWAGPAVAGLFLLLVLPFTAYALLFGIDGLAPPFRDTYLLADGRGAENVSLSIHMLSGGLITALALLQPVALFRQRAPGFHRWSGRVVVLLALVTALAGLHFILRQGTIGGWPMSLGFALYGLLMARAALQTVRLARRREWDRHRRWALRLLVLILGSWLFRVQYGLWYLATDGLASNEAFTGLFDRVMTVGFYLPWIIALELWLRRFPKAAPR